MLQRCCRSTIYMYTRPVFKDHGPARPNPKLARPRPAQSRPPNLPAQEEGPPPPPPLPPSLPPPIISTTRASREIRNSRPTHPLIHPPLLWVRTPPSHLSALVISMIHPPGLQTPLVANPAQGSCVCCLCLLFVEGGGITDEEQSSTSIIVD